MPGIPWTEKEKGLLRKLVEAGHDASACAEVFPDRTINSIRSQADSLGLRFVSPQAQINIQAAKMLLGEEVDV